VNVPVPVPDFFPALAPCPFSIFRARARARARARSRIIAESHALGSQLGNRFSPAPLLIFVASA
jgi:hypothetical protein